MKRETAYRRLARLFPAAWREQNEDELVAVLHEAAEHGRDRITLAETVDLVHAALVLRFRRLRTVLAGPAGAAAGAGAGPPTRRAGLAGLALLSTIGTVLALRSWTSEVSVEFLLTSLVVVVIPGTGVIYTVSSALGGGWRRGLFASVGCTLGIVPHVLAALLGLSGVMQAGAAAFEVVRWAGVAYLVFMGVSLIRERGGLQLDQDPIRSNADPMSLVVRRGILVNLLNPKLTVFFFSFLPQFLDSPPGLLDARLVGLGALFMFMTLVVFAAYAWASAVVRERVLAAPAMVRWIQRSLGGLVIGFAARLAATDR